MKLMSAKEFRELGFLQELNRLFLHPRGLALVTIQDTNGDSPEFMAGIWDARDEPEGLVFNPELLATPAAAVKRDRVEEEYRRHLEFRVAMFGNVIQEITS